MYAASGKSTSTRRIRPGFRNLVYRGESTRQVRFSLVEIVQGFQLGKKAPTTNRLNVGSDHSMHTSSSTGGFLDTL